MSWKFQDDFANAERELAKGMKAATKATATTALKAAQEAAPVDTGQMRDSGEINDAHQPVLGIAETSVDFTVPYAKWVHDGYYHSGAERFIAGRPFLANALSQSREELEDEAEKELKKLGVRRVRR